MKGSFLGALRNNANNQVVQFLFIKSITGNTSEETKLNLPRFLSVLCVQPLRMPIFFN